MIYWWNNTFFNIISWRKKYIFCVHNSIFSPIYSSHNSQSSCAGLRIYEKKRTEPNGVIIYLGDGKNRDKNVVDN